MRYTQFKQATAKTLALCALLLTAFAFTAKAGGDVYMIYLNDKLILKQAVYEPLKLKQLQLTQANINDKLVVYYSHCGTAGKGRSIAIHDENGKVLKQWKFADATGAKTGMEIAVKDLLQLEKKHAKSNLSIFYAAQELPKGRLLTSFNLSDKSTTYHNPQKNDWLITAGFVGLVVISMSGRHI